MNMNQIKITVPKGFKVVRVNDYEYSVVEDGLPKTWQEFCKDYKVQPGNAYIDTEAAIRKFTSEQHLDTGSRKNVLPSERIAEAILCLSQLIQLRDCYRQDWTPNFENNETKYCITFSEGEVTPCTSINHNMVFAFQTEELRNEFMKNFKDIFIGLVPLFD